MYINDPRSNENNRSRQLLAAIIVSQVDEIFVLDELDTISRLKQLSCSEILHAVLIKKRGITNC